MKVGLIDPNYMKNIVQLNMKIFKGGRKMIEIFILCAFFFWLAGKGPNTHY